MYIDDSRHTLKKLRGELEAWRVHIATLQLEDRERFILWLSEVITQQEFALIVDAEVDRQSLWETYLRERYGC